MTVNTKGNRSKYTPIGVGTACSRNEPSVGDSPMKAQKGTPTKGVSPMKSASIQNFDYSLPIGTSPQKKLGSSPLKALKSSPQKDIQKLLGIDEFASSFDPPSVTTVTSASRIRETLPGDSSEFNNSSGGGELQALREATTSSIDRFTAVMVAPAMSGKNNSSSTSPVSTVIESGDSSEYSSQVSTPTEPGSWYFSRAQERPSVQTTKSGDCSPVINPTEPESSDLDRIEQARIDELLSAMVHRIQEVLEQMGDSIDPSLAEGLEDYIKTAEAMEQGPAKKDLVWATYEHVNQLLLDISSQKASTPTTLESANASDSGSSSSSNSSTPTQPVIQPMQVQAEPQARSAGPCEYKSALQTKPHSPLFASLATPVNTGDVDAEGMVNKSPTGSGRHFRASRCQDELAFLTLMLESPGNGSEAFLHVYEVGMLGHTIHKVLGAFGTGAYHVGVEIYGREFSYGKGGGVSMNDPRKHLAHQYCGTISLGQTTLSPSQVTALVEQLKVLWPSSKYHALRNNCVSFAEMFCARLGVKAPPEHVGSLAKGLKDYWF